MTKELEQMKKLYATGEWVYVLDNSIIVDKPLSFKNTNYKLIHKKHRAILDHVLNGGEVKHRDGDNLFTVRDFINDYYENNTYEIIPLEHEEDLSIALVKLIHDGSNKRTHKMDAVRNGFIPPMLHEYEPKPVERITTQHEYREYEIYKELHSIIKKYGLEKGLGIIAERICRDANRERPEANQKPVITTEKLNVECFN